MKATTLARIASLGVLALSGVQLGIARSQDSPPGPPAGPGRQGPPLPPRMGPEARAEQMAAVGQTAASVAHQIGTPLNLISGYVQMIGEEEGPASRVTRRLEIVQEQIAKVTSIVRAMLDHARRPTPKEATDIGLLVQRVCDVARPKLEEVSRLGCRRLLECTPNVLGRDPELLRRLSDSVGLEIWSNTGLYGAANHHSKIGQFHSRLSCNWKKLYGGVWKAIVRPSKLRSRNASLLP